MFPGGPTYPRRCNDGVMMVLWRCYSGVMMVESQVTSNVFPGAPHTLVGSVDGEE
jgi:hypothetical protein